jgi:DNA replication protein DnaC
MDDAYTEIEVILKRLKLSSIRAELDNCLRLAEAKGLSHLEFLRAVLHSEMLGREQSSKKRRYSHARFPVDRTVEEFDFVFQKSIQKSRIVNLAECRWVEQAENLLLEGPPGTGKTHLAIALGQKAVEKGYRVRFYEAEQLLQEVYAHAAAGDTERYFKKLLKNDCIILDEFAYLPLDANAGNYLYQLVNRSYESISLVITSNKGIESWGDMFQDQAIAQAILDRFLHHCEVFRMIGESYRLKGPDTGNERE